MKTKAKYFYLTFLKKEKISKNVFAFYFGRKNVKLDFLAGQYAHLYLPVKNEKGRGNSRMFTIASSPLEKDFIFVAVKKGKSVFKKKLFNLIPNTPVKFFGPSGSLVMKDPPAGGNKPSYVFLAGGIGITPFRSILKYLDEKKFNIHITLLVSFSKKEEMCFYEELTNISKKSSNIKVIFAVGRLSKKIIKKYVKDMQKHLYYIAGSASVVSSLEDIISEMGVLSDKIFIEDFEGYL